MLLHKVIRKHSSAADASLLRQAFRLVFIMFCGALLDFIALAARHRAHRADESMVSQILDFECGGAVQVTVSLSVVA